MDCFSPHFKLGIVGGGQLGRMLLAEAQKYNLHTLVLDPNPDAPCKTACTEFLEGDITDAETVYRFGKKVQLLTLEIENVNVDALEQLEKEGIQVFPSAKTIRTIQDKTAQKLFYIDHQIPTPDFMRFAYTHEIQTAIERKTLSFPFVWKSNRMGYDGRGVKVVKTYSDLDNLPNVACLTENLVIFKKELAVLVARNANGEVRTYPVVEMQFHPGANYLEYAIAPARIEEGIASQAQLLALKVSQALEHTGLLAVELFLTETDELLVNEAAPRPHNSGHYTLEASYTNQFEQHLRAILNLPLGKTDNKIPAVMVNLVGKEGYQGIARYKNIPPILAIEGVSLHLYGKKETRPFRKMGHVTVVNKDVQLALKIAEKVKQTIHVTAENS